MIYTPESVKKQISDYIVAEAGRQLVQIFLKMKESTKLRAEWWHNNEKIRENVVDQLIHHGWNVERKKNVLKDDYIYNDLLIITAEE